MGIARILLPWDSQPQEGAGPNPDISQGLLSLILPNALSPINLSGSTNWAVQSGGVNGTGPAGRTLQTTATTDWWSTGISGGLITAGCTVLCYYRKTDSTNRASSLFGTNLGGGTTFFNAHAPYSNGTTYWDFGGNTGANRISVAGLSYSRPTCLVFTAGASGMLIAQDGISRVSSSTAVSRTHGGDSVAFGRAAVVAADLNETYLFAIWDRQLPTHQALEISRDPYGQLFAPRSIWIPVSAGGGGVNLVIADSAHAHAADNIGLTLDTYLALQDALHAHSADNLGLTLDTYLAVNEALHAHTADNLTLSTTGSTDLTVADAAHAHAADNLGLTLDTYLTIAEALHAHSADNVVLSTGAVANLVIADGVHAHAADNLAFTLDTWLAIADALHAHGADNLILTLLSNLTIADATHAHTADNVVLAFPLGALSDAEFRQMYDWLNELQGRNLLTVGTFIALK